MCLRIKLSDIDSYLFSLNPQEREVLWGLQVKAALSAAFGWQDRRYDRDLPDWHLGIWSVQHWPARTDSIRGYARRKSTGFCYRFILSQGSFEWQHHAQMSPETSKDNNPDAIRAINCFLWEILNRPQSYQEEMEKIEHEPRRVA